MTKRAILYARKSTIDKAAWAGLESQLELCREYAGANDWQIVGQLAEDNVSGADWMTPEIERALDLAESGVFDVLVARQMDRLARDLGKQLFIERQFEKAGVEVAYVLERYDDTPEGVLQKLVKGAIAEYERLEITRRLDRGKRARVKSGRVLVHGHPPYGYRETEDGYLIVHEEEAAIVRQVFDWYTEDGIGTRVIAGRLTKRRVLTWADKIGDGRRLIKKAPRCQWNSGSVGRILANETYIGNWTYHTGDSVAVPAIISQEQFDEARRATHRNAALSRRRTQHRYLLRGLVVCGRCGRSMGSQAKGPGGKVYLYYRCRAVDPGHYVDVCDARACRVDSVDPAVWAFVQAYLRSEEILNALAESLRAGADDREQLERELARLDNEIARLEGKRRGLLSFYLDQDWSKAELDRERDRIRSELAGVTAEYREIERRLSAGPELVIDQMERDRIALRDQLDGADFERRRSIVLQLFDRVELERDARRAVVHFTGGAAYELNF